MGYTVEGARKSGLILVVDDERAIRVFVRDALTEAGYEVVDVDHADVAMRFVRRYAGRIRLIITDIGLPEGGGIDLGAYVSRECEEIGILYISGMTGTLAVDGIMTSAPEAVLLKPFSAAQLVDRVRALGAVSPPAQ